MATHRANRRLWRKFFTGLLYFPDDKLYVLHLLETSGVRGFTSELDRLVALGSPWASATLGYIALVPEVGRARDTARARELCGRHAAAGDPYSQFVYSWALIYEGDHNRAIEYMERAMAARFPPAIVDLAKFVWFGWGTKERYRATALKLLRFAARVGHKGAPCYRYAWYKTGELGFIRMVIGWLLLPVAALRYEVTARADPFSCDVFVFQSTALGPLLKTVID
jgi:hypothetical protein